MTKLKTFKTKKIAVPENFIRIELSVEEFTKLAEKFDFSPVFENNSGLAYLDGKQGVFYYVEKETKP